MSETITTPAQRLTLVAGLLTAIVDDGLEAATELLRSDWSEEELRFFLCGLLTAWRSVAELQPDAARQVANAVRLCAMDAGLAE